MYWIRVLTNAVGMVMVVLAAVVCARKKYRLRRVLVELRRSVEVVDANIADIRSMRIRARLWGDQIVAERTRQELRDVDLAALARHLKLTTTEFGQASC